MDTIVSITKVKNSIENSVMEAVNLAGGMESIVNKGEEVYLKPNFVAPRDSSKGVTTNFEMIRVIAEDVRRCGGIPILYETPAIEFEKENVYNFLGVYDFAEKNKIQLIDDPVDYIKVAVDGGKVFKSIKIPRFLHKAKIINMPKLKTHITARMTCGMKNLIGLLPNSEKRRAHISGVHASVADICKVFQPVLTVVDAITCMDGDGPTYGNPKDVGVIIAGKDMVSVDKISSQIIGLSWQDIEYIRLFDSGNGNGNIQVIGESVKDIMNPFHIPHKSEFYHLSTRLLHIFDIPFSGVFPTHLSQFLFSTGHFGTNPRIIRDKCDKCGDCVKVCPVENVLNVETYKIQYKYCIRCMECYLACDKHAITVKGFSRPEQR